MYGTFDKYFCFTLEIGVIFLFPYTMAILHYMSLLVIMENVNEATKQWYKMYTNTRFYLLLWSPKVKRIPYIWMLFIPLFISVVVQLQIPCLSDRQFIHYTFPNRFLSFYLRECFWYLICCFCMMTCTMSPFFLVPSPFCLLID